MKIVVSNHSELPIYAQIREQIKEQILTGIIAEGTILPSIRQLAKELGISVITTTRAYNELEAEGFISSMQGKGSVVLSRNNTLVQEQYLKRIEEHLQAAMENAKYAGLTKNDLIQILENFYSSFEKF